MSSNYTLLSIIELSNELEDEYNSVENSWITCENDNEKKKTVVITLSWCKRNRDMFDGMEPFTLDEIELITEHETKWVDRTIVWRSRFNEYYSAGCLPNHRHLLESNINNVNN